MVMDKGREPQAAAYVSGHQTEKYTLAITLRRLNAIENAESEELIAAAGDLDLELQRTRNDAQREARERRHTVRFRQHTGLFIHDEGQNERRRTRALQGADSDSDVEAGDPSESKSVLGTAIKQGDFLFFKNSRPTLDGVSGTTSDGVQTQLYTGKRARRGKRKRVETTEKQIIYNIGTENSIDTGSGSPLQQEENIQDAIDMDLKIFALLERRFGCLDEQLFYSAKLPGAMYRIMISSRARCIQKTWTRYKKRIFLKRNHAAYTIQGFWRTVEARRIASFLAAKLSRLNAKASWIRTRQEHRTLCSIFAEWKQFAVESKRLFLLLSAHNGVTIVKAFGSWKAYCEDLFAVRRRKMIIFAATLENRRLEKCFRAWKRNFMILKMYTVEAKEARARRDSLVTFHRNNPPGTG